MSTDNDASPSGRPRRSSIADLFTRRSADPVPSPGQPTAASATTTAASANPRSVGAAAGTVPIASAIAHAQHNRRVSITSIGLSGGAAGINGRMVSGSSSSSSSGGGGISGGNGGAIDDNESAVDDSGDAVGSLPTSGAGSPFGRRVSSGARAYGEARARPGSSAGAMGGQQSPTASLRGKDGFNFPDSMRDRAERASVSAASTSGSGNPGLGNGLGLAGGVLGGHVRTKSVATSTPATMAAASQPAAAAPPPVVPRKPDYIQERILKGDFYMD